jgi:hypothetical protein
LRFAARSPSALPSVTPLSARIRLVIISTGSRSVPNDGSDLTAPRASVSVRIARTTAFRSPRTGGVAPLLLNTCATRCT